MKKVAFHTLGCKLNFSETATIARLFEEQGYEKVEMKESSDIYVINTCSVTSNADKECKQIVRAALKQSPDAYVVIVGCYAQLKPEEIANIEGVDLVLGASEKFKLLSFLNDLTKKEEAEVHNCEIEEATTFVNSYSLNDRTRVFLKVQDGCDYSCSFCTIPLARGMSRSDTIEHTINNVNEIAKKGINEIVLTGINLGDFGKNENAPESKFGDEKAENFYELLQELDKLDTIKRFRISSIEPNLLSNDIIDFVATSNKIAPHFHIPLQSGCNKILKMMRRRYVRELYVDRVNRIKQKMPHCCIGVDVIVGFPGESDKDFLETYHFLNGLDVTYLHVFTYSERANTDAATMKDIVPIIIRKKRNKMLRILSAKKTHQFYENHINESRAVLFEADNKRGMMHGFTDNYIKVKTPFNSELINQMENVKLISIDATGEMEVEFGKKNNRSRASVESKETNLH